MNYDESRRQARIAAGQCTHCGGKPHQGRRRCFACLKADAAKSAERMRRIRAARKVA